MAITIGPTVTPLIFLARDALGMTQKEMADMFGKSLRTTHRWEMGKSYPDIDETKRLATAVFPRNPGVAAQLAAEAGTTLEALGLVAPPAPPQAAPVYVAAPAPSRAFPPIELMVDSIVLAAIDAASTQNAPSSREAVPAILKAAFARARGLGLTTEEIDDALSSARA